jgi:hypothetical protein
MIRALLALLITGILSRCGKNSSTLPTFHAFDFSYNDTWSTGFSIKFTQKDSVFIRQHAVYANYTGDTNVKDRTSYFAILNHSQRLTLDSFIRNIDFAKFDHVLFRRYSGRDSKQVLYRNRLFIKINIHIW